MRWIVRFPYRRRLYSPNALRQNICREFFPYADVDERNRNRYNAYKYEYLVVFRWVLRNGRAPQKLLFRMSRVETRATSSSFFSFSFYDMKVNFFMDKRLRLFDLFGNSLSPLLTSPRRRRCDVHYNRVHDDDNTHVVGTRTYYTIHALIISCFDGEEREKKIGKKTPIESPRTPSVLNNITPSP